MHLTWGERWLLEIAVHAWIPLRSLIHPRLDREFTRPGHDLELPELADALERLLERGDAVAQTDALGAHRPPRAALLAALVFEPAGARGPDPLCFGLTPQGGARWEQEAGADWSRYVRAGSSLEEPDDERWFELVGVDRARVAARLAAQPDARPETVFWERVEPWSVGPWKTFPVAHRVRYLRRPEDFTAPAWPPRRPPAEPWFREAERES